MLGKALAEITRRSQTVLFHLERADANENAVKIARMYAKKWKIITRYRSYHARPTARSP